MNKDFDDECKQAARTIAWLTGIDNKTENDIEDMLRKTGMKNFFNNLDALNLSDEVVEKLKLLRDVVSYIDASEVVKMTKTGGAYQ